MRPLVATAVAVAVAVALLSGCTSAPAAPPPPTPRTTLTPVDTWAARQASGKIPGNEGIRVVRKSGSIPPTLAPTRWIAAGLDRPADTLEVDWWRGVCEKENLEVDVYVEETADSVIVDVYDDPTIHLPAGSDACSGSAALATHTVTLTEPLGTRTLLEHETAAR
ncbi:hypothetical protein AS850_07680 [Frondihabitans sp. 762G35]|uniref:hypothetical protein n=1 Tax=Frondihabitans sp. 762G35 TaxID=1446794 RepID=UPI000D204772|nr:hypothetical protein [Frondihabitans sp. 762G35]ARC56957.1 hypothetical protein AS850_07680 [Frondihabitans sp. 762G35]